MSNLKWKDTSSWRQSTTAEQRKTPEEWTLCAGNIRIMIHHYIGCGSTWFVTCHILGLSKMELVNTDPDKAKSEAIGVVIKYITKLSKLVPDLQELL